MLRTPSRPAPPTPSGDAQPGSAVKRARCVPASALRNILARTVAGDVDLFCSALFCSVRSAACAAVRGALGGKAGRQSAALVAVRAAHAAAANMQSPSAASTSSGGLLLDGCLAAMAQVGDPVCCFDLTRH